MRRRALLSAAPAFALVPPLLRAQPVPATAGEAGVRAADVERIDLKVHPLVLELTGKTGPRSGLEGKFSVFHSAAIALIDGAGGEAQFADCRVSDAQATALRERVRAHIDPGLAMDAAEVTVTLRDGVQRAVVVDHCIGSRERPLSDDQLDLKFTAQCEPVLGTQRTAQALAFMRQIDQCSGVQVCAVACALP